MNVNFAPHRWGRTEWSVGLILLLVYVGAIAVFGVIPTLLGILAFWLLGTLLRAGPLTLLALLFLGGTVYDS